MTVTNDSEVRTTADMIRDANAAIRGAYTVPPPRVGVVTESEYLNRIESWKLLRHLGVISPATFVEKVKTETAMGYR